MSDLEALLEQHIRLTGLPAPAREYRFHPRRRWRFDFAWPLYKVAVEVDGGIYCRSRHVRGTGFERDAEKRNAAVLAGWRVLHSLHAANGQIRSGGAGSRKPDEGMQVNAKTRRGQGYPRDSQGQRHRAPRASRPVRQLRAYRRGRRRALPAMRFAFPPQPCADPQRAGAGIRERKRGHWPHNTTYWSGVPG